MLTRENLLFSPSRDNVPSSDDAFCADDLLSAQQALEEEAREVLPFDFTTCTYDLGPLKQAVYSCLTCLSPNGICSACSITCHGDHELVELFNRREYTCDCGTLKMGEQSKCLIGKRSGERINEGNRYDANFEGTFCFCGVKYDPMTETDEMYQCIVCEDWIHHACLFGSHSNNGTSPLATDDFDMLACERCVLKPSTGVRALVERWTGVDNLGFMIVGKEGKVYGTLPLEEDEEEEVEEVVVESKEEGEGALGSVAASAGKRKVEAVEELELSKRPKPESQVNTSQSSGSQASTSRSTLESNTTTLTSPLLPSPVLTSTNSTICSAPPLPTIDNPSILSKIQHEGGKVNIYFAEDWREKWCRCSECLPRLFRFPYFLEEEETYEPPEDEEFKSTEELGMAALENLPREQAIEGAIAFTGLSARLKEYLKPFADQKLVVTKAMIDDFFEAERERRL